jgi:hypothetical protein
MIPVKEKPIKKPTDKILIQGLVTVWQGEGRDKKILIRKAKNHWVDAGLKGLISALVCDYLRGAATITYYYYFWAYAFTMYLGSNTTTPTTHAMTALTTPIGAAPGTPPNATSGTGRTNPASGTWKCAFQGVWYAGTVSGTVGEMALYLRPWDNITVGWNIDLNATGNKTQNRVMTSRLSAADGDFSAFAIDTSKSLTVYWEIQVTYA